MGLANKVINATAEDAYIISTMQRHIKDYYVPEFGQNLDMVYEARISYLKPGKRMSKRKDVVAYVNYCNDMPLTIETFHLGVCCLIRYASYPMIDFIVDVLNKNPSSTIAKRNGGHIYPNEVHIFTLAYDFKPTGLKEPLSNIMLPLR